MIEKYQWRPHYEAALLETDPGRLPRLIRRAEIVIDARLEELRLSGANAREEKDAIAEALAGLNVLRKEVRLVG
jgi:hypothetical protein